MAKSAKQPDWDALTEEATRLLAEYLRLDTTNPPGNEVIACDWLAAILDAEGIPYQRFALDPARPSLVARLAGDGTGGGALLLLNHTDVVPAEAAHWQEPPLSGTVHDGYVWGRGAVDMKGMGILELVTMLACHRLRIPLRRDLVFAAVADEEAGGTFGVEFLATNHPDTLVCDFVINEGGTGAAEVFGIQHPVFHVGVAEKGPLWLRLRAEGTPGHGSVPHSDSALERLVRALARVQAWERPLVATDEVLAYFEALHAAGFLPSPPSTEVLHALAAEHPRIHSMLSNSIAVTSVRAGVRPNVIPAEAEATLDVRLVTGYSPDRFLDELAAVIDDPAVSVEVIFSASTPTSPTDSALYRAIEAAASGACEGGTIVPSISTGFTDSRVFRRLGIPAYGFMPLLLAPEDMGTVHGNDERLSIASLRLGLRILFDTVRHVCE
jgi:acetylornithine deacetylase/succinyl-diaminopimelate desuccinylase-like protein